MRDTTRALLARKLGRAVPNDAQKVTLSIADIGRIVEAALAEAEPKPIPKGKSYLDEVIDSAAVPEATKATLRKAFSR